MSNLLNKNRSGFTIIELLVVIVVIGILAAVTVISYVGISQNAIASSVKSDLNNASKQLKLYQVEMSSFPTSLDANNCPVPANLGGNYCIKTSPGNSLSYSTLSGQDFRLTATKDNISYSTTNTTSPSVTTTSQVCPSGFIPVPGSGTYSTSDFCIMKYEAKNVSGVATSQATGIPWTSISQDSAKTVSSAVCSGCHLVTEAEWMTIAQNILSVPSNWSGGAVGSGRVYIGDSDTDVGQTASLSADSNDNLGYAGTGNSAPSDQRRTLTLTNGSVIWDLSGNAREWTAGTTQGGQPGRPGNDWYFYHDWKGGITSLGTLAVNPSPVGTGIPGSTNWSSTNGIGSAWVNSNDTNLVGFIRGGSWDGYSVEAGILYFDSSRSPSFTAANLGFRVAK
jgi:prepilin-type N-terminal cleavage/methylation domain-containing protein